MPKAPSSIALACGLWGTLATVATIVLVVVAIVQAFMIEAARSKCEGDTAIAAAATAAATAGIAASCPEETYPVPGTGKCFACPPQCAACTGPYGACVSCIPGYGLVGDTCEPCAAGSVGLGGVCTACVNGTYTPFAGSTSCAPCPGQCYPGACTKDTGACTSCRSGEHITTLGLCVPCIGSTWSPAGSQPYCQPCGEGQCDCCDSATGVCSHCTPGHAPPNCEPCVEGSMWTLGAAPCAPCAVGCTACTPTDGTCSGCESGYTLAGGRCVVLP